MRLDTLAQNTKAQAVPALSNQAKQAAKLSRDMHEWMTQKSYDVCHLLVDPQLRPIQKTEPLGQTLDQCVATASDAAPYTITLSITKDHSPWFVPLQVDRASGSHAIAFSLEDGITELNPDSLLQGLGRRIGGWFISEATKVQIGLHLSKVMVQTAPGGKRMLLRIHDSSVLWLLWAILTPVQQIQLLGPIQHWFILDLTGQLIRLDRPAIPAETTIEPLRLNDVHWGDVLNMQAINLALTTWAANRIKDHPIDAKELHTVTKTAIAAVRRARSLGIDDNKDLSLFAQHAFQIAPAFDSHPDVAALLAQCDPRQNTDPNRYSAAIDSLTADDWSRISRETQGIAT